MFVWEKCLINFKQRLLVVDEEVQQMIPVLVCKINSLNSVFSKLGEPKERLFEVTSFVSGAQVGELVSVLQLVL